MKKCIMKCDTCQKAPGKSDAHSHGCGKLKNWPHLRTGAVSLDGCLALGLLFAFAAAAPGQSIVQLRNGLTTLVTNRTVAPWPTAGSLLFGLLTAPPGTTDLMQFSPTGVLATNLATEGRVSGPPTAIPGWPPGQFAGQVGELRITAPVHYPYHQLNAFIVDHILFSSSPIP